MDASGSVDGSDTDTVIALDEYGFAIRDEEEIEEESPLDGSFRCHIYSPCPGPAVAERWKTVCDDWMRYERASSQKLRQLVRRGIPLELRSRVWQLFLNSTVLRSNSSFDYKASLAQLCSELEAHGVTEKSTEVSVRKLNALVDARLTEEGRGGEEGGKEETGSDSLEWIRNTRQIMMDIIRTFPTHHLYMGETATKESLFRVLMVYTKYNPTVGYCQGMAYVAALLLMYMSEEDSFWALVSLFDRPKYLAGYYDPSLSRIKTHADVFGLLLKDKLPQLAEHLESLGVHPLMYVTTWFMCLFTTLPCWDTVLTICDLLFLEGINTIFRAAIAIMKVCAPEVLAMYGIEKVLPFLQRLPSRLVSHKNFIPVLWQTTVHSWEVDLYQDMVFRDQDWVEIPRPLKRAAPVDGGEEQMSLPTKRKRMASEDDQAALSTNRSLLSKIVNVITPAKLAKTEPFTPTRPLPQTPATSLPRTSQSRKRNILIPRFKTPSLRASAIKARMKRLISSGTEGERHVLEMQEFSIWKQTISTPSGRSDFVDSACVFLGEGAVCTKSEAGQSDSSTATPVLVRRSSRLARRRSLRQGSSEFPTLSVVPPRSERPLQETVQTTRHPTEHHAFRMFSTPTPLRPTQKRRRGDSGQSPSKKTPMSSPEVELRPLKRRRQGESRGSHS